MRLMYLDISAFYKVKDAFVRPFHVGNRWRGALGYALREVSREAYELLYTPEESDALARRAQQIPGASLPRPMVPLVPAPGQYRYEAGERIKLGIRLFGEQAFTRRQTVFDALDVVGRRLRSRPDPKRTAQNKPHASIALDEIRTSLPRHLFEQGDILGASQHAPNEQLDIDLLTPAHFRVEGKCVERPDFHDLYRLAQGRAWRMALLYGSVESTLSTPSPLHIPLVHHNVRPMRWAAPADERRRRRPMRGIIGRLSYRGPVGPYMAPFLAAERLHIGSDTTYGLGRIRLGLSASSPRLSKDR